MPLQKKKRRKKKKKAKINEDPKVVRTLLMCAERGDMQGLNKLFSRDGGEDFKKIKDRYDIKNGMAAECIVRAAEKGHCEAIELILANGGILDYANGKPLQRASLHKQLDAVKLLVEKNADINGQSLFAEFTPLQLASQVGCMPVVNYLLDQPGIKPDMICHPDNCGTNNGWSALHFAADNGHLDVVQKLIDAGVPIDLPTESGDTAAAIAAESGKFRVVRRLVAIGSNIHAKRRGLSLVQWALYRAQSAMVQFLVSYGANPSLETKVLWFPDGLDLGQVCRRDFSAAIYEKVDTAIYRGGLLLRERAAHRRLIAEVWWESVTPYDPISFDPNTATEIRSFPPNVVHLISAYEM